MYWQVYLHKTVLCAEQMLQQIIKRAKQIKAAAPMPLHKLINDPESKVTIDEFCGLDDYDVLTAIKMWSMHEDKVLSTLCKGIINRQLLKVKYYAEPVDKNLIAEKTTEACIKLNISKEEAAFFVFTGEAVSSTYNFDDEHIYILFKDGSVKDISEVDNALINQNMKGKIKKYYICYLR